MLFRSYFVTHRKHGVDYVPFDSLTESSDGDEYGSLRIKSETVLSAHISVTGCDPAKLVESRDVVERTMEKLSDDGRKILSAVIDGNELLQINLQLVGDRAKHVFGNGGSVRLKPWHVADSLGMDESRVKCAFKEIKQAYREACDE